LLFVFRERQNAFPFFLLFFWEVSFSHGTQAPKAEVQALAAAVAAQNASLLAALQSQATAAAAATALKADTAAVNAQLAALNGGIVALNGSDATINARISALVCIAFCGCPQNQWLDALCLVT
jgi:hypothetical protein